MAVDLLEVAIKYRMCVYYIYSVNTSGPTVPGSNGYAAAVHGRARDKRTILGETSWHLGRSQVWKSWASFYLGPRGSHRAPYSSSNLWNDESVVLCNSSKKQLTDEAPKLQAGRGGSWEETVNLFELGRAGKWGEEPVASGGHKGPRAVHPYKWCWEYAWFWCARFYTWGSRVEWWGCRELLEVRNPASVFWYVFGGPSSLLCVWFDIRIGIEECLMLADKC